MLTAIEYKINFKATVCVYMWIVNMVDKEMLI